MGPQREKQQGIVKELKGQVVGAEAEEWGVNREEELGG